MWPKHGIASESQSPLHGDLPVSQVIAALQKHNGDELMALNDIETQRMPCPGCPTPVPATQPIQPVVPLPTPQTTLAPPVTTLSSECNVKHDPNIPDLCRYTTSNWDAYARQVCDASGGDAKAWAKKVA